MLHLVKNFFRKRLVLYSGDYSCWEEACKKQRDMMQMLFFQK